MLIFISDLHFDDGSAGEHNVPTDAFKIFFEDIAGTADWLTKEGRVIDEIKLVFLGDIFDLWVALPRYEDDAQRQFVAWCREQKKHRTIGFMEGNHEYYLARNRAQDFSWCSAAAWRPP
ncbi:MAG: hypothetical protein P8017_11290, partial [Deltaproteobacteria bacterium]